MFRPLEMEIDELSHKGPIRKWDLSVPLETRMAFLRKYGTYQHQIIQAECQHKKFEKGFCLACDYECEHPEVDEMVCLDCGEFCAVDRDWEDDEGEWRVE